MGGMLYLNLDSPAECTGTVSSLKYCHYPVQTTDRHRTHVGIYRRMGTDYVPVPGSEVTLEVNEIQVGFSCNTVSLPGSIQVEPGDVVGACVAEPQQGPNNLFLMIVGENATGLSVHGMTLSSPCNLNELQNPVSMGSLMPVNSSILHLFAIISE